MGIGINEIYLLIHSTNKKSLGEVLTIGRQEIHLETNEIVNILKKFEIIKKIEEYKEEKYCEKMLMVNFNATSVESVDNSSYENATHIFDLNNIISNKLSKEYDTIIDFGCTEHIYNVSNALENISNLCKEGGQILHVLPANNMCGHGFWQFSPEVFFSLYSNKNGYKDTEIYLSDYSNLKVWYKVNSPTKGDRINIKSTTKSSMYLIVKTIKNNKRNNHKEVQQSDYVSLWENNNDKKIYKNNDLKEYIKNIKYLYNIIKPIYYYVREIFNNNNKLNTRNKNVLKVEIKKLLMKN